MTEACFLCWGDVIPDGTKAVAATRVKRAGSSVIDLRTNVGMPVVGHICRSCEFLLEQIDPDPDQCLVCRGEAEYPCAVTSAQLSRYKGLNNIDIHGAYDHHGICQSCYSERQSLSLVGRAIGRVKNLAAPIKIPLMGLLILAISYGISSVIVWVARVLF